MFFNPDDIRWFKPLELWTKHGFSGHIRQPIGTHGSMKCNFNGHIKNHDTVCLTLYKRVYPKYPTEEEINKVWVECVESTLIGCLTGIKLTPSKSVDIVKNIRTYMKVFVS